MKGLGIIIAFLIFSSMSYALDDSSSITATVTVLPAKLGIILISPVNNGYYFKEDVPLTFTINGKASWIGYSLDNKKNVTIKRNTTLEELKDGSHTIIAYAKDTFGNSVASNKVSFFY